MQSVNKNTREGITLYRRPVRLIDNGKLKALNWRNGKYDFSGSGKALSVTISGCNTVEITGSWKVKLPAGNGIPAKIVLPSLISLYKHPEFDVKHFSGTAVYTKTIKLNAADLQKDRKLFLDPARVEVIAEVKVNGHMAGNAWKEPFRIDITKFCVQGSNQLK